MKKNVLPQGLTLATTLGLLLIGAAAPPAHVTRPALGVASSFVERDLQGSIHLIGEVVNQSAHSYGHVQVVAFSYGADGSVTGTTAGFTLLSMLRPGQRSPFDLIFGRSSGTRYAAIVRGEPVRGAPPVLEVAGLTMLAAGNGVYHVQGWARNKGAVVARYVEVVATLYGPSGRLVGLGLGALDTPSVSVHERTHFTVTAAAVGHVAHVLVQVQGAKP